MSLNIQVYLLIHTILYGVFLGLCFDTLDMYIQRVKKRICRDIIIILFWTVQLPLAVLFFHRVNQGEFQSYLLIFVLLGGLIYFKIFKKKYAEDLKVLIKICSKVFKWIKKVLNLLIFKPIAFIFSAIFDIIVLSKKFFRKKRLADDEKEPRQDGEFQSS